MPRLGELLHSRVVDVDGAAVGPVSDVRLVQDGPFIEGFGQALRVDGLVVGRHGLFLRLGYQRHEVTGPWLVRVLARRADDRALHVPWGDVGSWGGGEVRLTVRAADLTGLR